MNALPAVSVPQDGEKQIAFSHGHSEVHDNPSTTTLGGEDSRLGDAITTKAMTWTACQKTLHDNKTT